MMSLIVIIAFTILLHQISFGGSQFTPPLKLGPKDPDSDVTVEQLVHSRGFALEIHSVVTEDGYMLSIHRLVPKSYSAKNYTTTRKPVIVQHGLFGASTDFLINSPHRHSPNSSYGDTFGFALLLTERYVYAIV